jgi:hypothetical protein
MEENSLGFLVFGLLTLGIGVHGAPQVIANRSPVRV